MLKCWQHLKFTNVIFLCNVVHYGFPALNFNVLRYHLHYCQISPPVWLNDTLHSYCIYFFSLWFSLTVVKTADSLLTCCNPSTEQYWLEYRWCCSRRDSTDGGLGVEQKENKTWREVQGIPEETCGNFRSVVVQPLKLVCCEASVQSLSQVNLARGSKYSTKTLKAKMEKISVWTGVEHVSVGSKGAEGYRLLHLAARLNSHQHFKSLFPLGSFLCEFQNGGVMSSSQTFSPAFYRWYHPFMCKR